MWEVQSEVSALSVDVDIPLFFQYKKKKKLDNPIEQEMIITNVKLTYTLRHIKRNK